MAAPASMYAEVALVLFLVAFVAIVVLDLRAGVGASHATRPRRLPLDDDDAARPARRRAEE